MSLVTRCPACSTMFKVVPDQLRISEGWVRCGQCDEVFDAHAQLVVGDGFESPVAFQVQPEPPAAETEVATADFGLDALEFPVEAPLADEEPQEAAEEAIPAAPVAEPQSVPNTRDEPAWDAGAEVAAPVEPTLGPMAAAAPGAGVPRWDDLAQEESVQYSFVQGAGAASRWHAPWVRGLLAFSAVLLLLGLLLQVLLQQRDHLAASVPASRAPLVMLCDWAGCELTPLRQIESLVIDASSFTKVRGDIYRLNFTLKNAAHFPLAVPAMELTLTDGQDQPVLRRVFLVPDYGYPRDSLGAQAEVAASLPLHISAPAGRVQGYRLVAFYP